MLKNTILSRSLSSCSLAAALLLISVWLRFNKMDLNFETFVKNFKQDQKTLKVLFERAIKILKPKKSILKDSINVVFTDDEGIRKLNRQHRGINKPTDVLSFSYIEKENFPVDNTIGEIIISVETSASQAIKHQKSLQQEIQFLFVHGLLHIFGHDHELPAERKIMFDLQDRILLINN